MPMTPVGPHPVVSPSAQRMAELVPAAAGTGTGRTRGLRKIADQVTRSTREHPQAAFGLAFIAGLVLARGLRQWA